MAFLLAAIFAALIAFLLLSSKGLPPFRVPGENRKLKIKII
jgi:hypothetical protein